MLLLTYTQHRLSSYISLSHYCQRYTHRKKGRLHTQRHTHKNQLLHIIINRYTEPQALHRILYITLLLLLTPSRYWVLLITRYTYFLSFPSLLLTWSHIVFSFRQMPMPFRYIYYILSFIDCWCHAHIDITLMIDRIPENILSQDILSFMPIIAAFIYYIYIIHILIILRQHMR